MKKVLFGSAIVLASLMSLSSSAQAQTPVLDLCPNVSWADGYNVWELIPLAPNDYKTVTVTGDFVNVRSRMGFDAPVMFTIDLGSQVTKTGESYDSACNQWVRVRISGNFYWIHGNYLTP